MLASILEASYDFFSASMLEAGEKVKTILTKEGVPVLVDDEDYEWLSQYRWKLDKDGYVIRYARHPEGKKRGTYLRMHREVMGLAFKDPRQVDHRFGIKTDNRKTELRICTVAQNTRNSPKHADSKNPYKGIWWEPRRRKWRSRVCANGKRTLLGHFDTAEEAYEAYRNAVLKLHGEFANHQILQESEGALQPAATDRSANDPKPHCEVEETNHE